MTRPEITVIAAVARNGVIGRDNGLPWRLKADLAHFKRTTIGHPVVMGRKTWASLGRPLAGRRNIVVSRNRNLRAEGAQVVDSLDAAISACEDDETIFVIGGAQLYAQVLPIADRLLITEIQSAVEGDARFPDFDRSNFHETQRTHHMADAENDHAVDFVEYRRCKQR